MLFHQLTDTTISMPWEDKIKSGAGIPIPFWTACVILALWLGYQQDWFALALVAILAFGQWMALKLTMEIIRAGAREDVKPKWWDEYVELPHPSEQSHSADVIRHKYRRAVRKIYP
jgi:hypothetical protein